MNLTVRRWPLVGRERELRSFASVWAEPRYSAFVICGSAGVGKTRLAEECLEGIAREGTRVGRATASRAASVVPLGAIAHLLPSGVDLSDPVQGFAAVTRKLSGPDQGQSVVLVDDMHLLDETSAVLLRQLMDARVVRIITTIRTGEVVGNAVDALVREATPSAWNSRSSTGTRSNRYWKPCWAAAWGGAP